MRRMVTASSFGAQQLKCTVRRTSGAFAAHCEPSARDTLRTTARAHRVAILPANEVAFSRLAASMNCTHNPTSSLNGFKARSKM